MSTSEEPIKKYQYKKGQFIFKAFMAAGYGKSRSALYMALSRRAIRTSNSKQFSPKEIKEIVDTIGEPDWDIVYRLINSSAHK